MSFEYEYNNSKTVKLKKASLVLAFTLLMHRLENYYVISNFI
jgi:hypothetical protein